jgi:uncharacterized protein DUF4190
MGQNPEPPPQEPPPAQIAGQQTTPSTVPHTPGLAGYAATPAPTNNLAVVSFIAGIASFFAHVIPVIGGFTVAIVAIVTGFIARGQIKRTGEQGMWMANAGIIIGFVHLVLGFLLVIVVLFVIFVLGIALFGIAASGGHPASPTPLPTG